MIRILLKKIMGTWGIRNFENDTAMDWVADFELQPTVVFLEQTIQSVFEEEYLESDTIMRALAAIEIIAAIINQPAVDLPELNIEDLSVLASSVNDGLIVKCRIAIERILDPKDNELYELWAETPDIDNWIKLEHDLETRLLSGQTRNDQ